MIETFTRLEVRKTGKTNINALTLDHLILSIQGDEFNPFSNSHIVDYEFKEMGQFQQDFVNLVKLVEMKVLTKHNGFNV